MSDKIKILKQLYVSSTYTKDIEIFQEVIEKAAAQGIEVSVRSLKNYKKKYVWVNPNTGLKPGSSPIQPKFKGSANKVVKQSREKANKEIKDKADEQGRPVSTESVSPLMDEERITQTMTWLLQGASRDRIMKQFRKNGVLVDRKQVDYYIQEAFNVFQSIMPQQRETIIGLNLERLNLLFQTCLNEINTNPRTRAVMIKTATAIVSEINMMFGVKGINLNLSNEQNITGKVASMTDEEKYRRLIELKQKADGSFSE